MNGMNPHPVSGTNVNDRESYRNPSRPFYIHCSTWRVQLIARSLVGTLSSLLNSPLSENPGERVELKTYQSCQPSKEYG